MMSSIGRSPALPPSSFDGELGAVALLLAQLDVGTGEPGDDADLDRLVRGATALTPADRPATGRNEEGHAG